MTKEIWKDIKDYEGLYMISSKGNIKSLDRYAKHISKRGKIGLKLIKGRALKPRVKDNAYLYVTLCKDGTLKNHYMHRLVAEAFLDNPDNKPEIDHLDTNRTNNCVENLRWSTSSENRSNPLTVLKKCLKLDGRNASIVAAENGVTKSNMHQRLSRGWSLRDACTVPTNTQFRSKSYRQHSIY